MTTMEERVAAAVAGDRHAAAALLAELLPRVRNLVRYFLRSDDIDDVVQEGLIAVLRGLPTYRAEGSLVSWSDRVVARIAIAEARRRRGRAGDAPDELPSNADDPEEYVARRRIVRVLDSLSLEMREALVMHHVLEMSVPEIAEELAVPAETVRSRLRNGRAYVRERLAASSDGRSSP